MWQELHFSLRQIHRRRWFSAIVISLLAVGIGANTLMFSLVNAFLWRPLSIRNPSNLFLLKKIRQQQVRPETDFNYQQFLQLTARRDLFSGVVAGQEWNKTTVVPFTLGSDGSVGQVTTQIVSPNYFSELGVQAFLGRMLTESDASLDSGEIPVVLSYRFWQSQLAGNRSLIGHGIRLRNRPFLIVGIVARDFHDLDIERAPDVRLPPSGAVPLLGHSLETLSGDDRPDFNILVRLAPGVPAATALPAVLPQIQSTGEWFWQEWNAHRKEPWPKEWMEEVLRSEREYRLALLPVGHGTSQLREQFSATVFLLMGGVVFLLVVVCANVAGLLLTRSEDRRMEIAVRLAMGAGRTRVLSQLLTEYLLLAICSATMGMVLARAFLPVLLSLLPDIRGYDQYSIPRLINIPFDYRVFLFTACVSVLGVLFFGTMPACRYTQLDLSSQLKANSATIARRSLGITAGSIQIGFSTILLITAILMIKTFSNLERLNPGFDRAHILDVTVDPKSAGYSQTEAGVFFREFKERVAAMPGVRSVAYAGLGVMRGSGSKGTFAPQGITLSQTAFLNVSLNSVTPSYFETMGIGLLSGRSFVVEDLKRKPRPVIVNRTFANVFFPRENAVGKLLVNGFDGKKPADAVIVGICETAKYRSMREEDTPTVYSTLDEGSGYDKPMLMYVRTYGDPATIVNEVRNALHKADPNIPLVEVRTLEQELQSSLWQERLVALLSGFFGFVALTLSSIGLYATLAYSVARRRRELGIRIALGAQPSQILRTVSTHAVYSLAIGLTGGILASVFLLNVLRRFLYGVNVFDMLAFSLAVGAICSCSIVAILHPAWQAITTNPHTVLRDE